VFCFSRPDLFASYNRYPRLTVFLRIFLFYRYFRSSNIFLMVNICWLFSLLLASLVARFILFGGVPMRLGWGVFVFYGSILIYSFQV
jgi:hypothetical protein